MEVNEFKELLECKKKNNSISFFDYMRGGLSYKKSYGDTRQDYKMCSECKEYKPFKDFSKANKTHENQKKLQGMCKACAKVSNKKYYEEVTSIRDFVYLILSKKGEVLYVGSCVSLHARVLSHLKGKSNIGKTAREWIDLDIGSIAYADIASLVENDNEKRYVERLYIDMYNPKLNKAKINTTPTEERKAVLESAVMNNLLDFKIEELEHIGLENGEVTLNLDDLKLI